MNQEQEIEKFEQDELTKKDGKYTIKDHQTPVIQKDKEQLNKVRRRKIGARNENKPNLYRCSFHGDRSSLGVA